MAIARQDAPGSIGRPPKDDDFPILELMLRNYMSEPDIKRVHDAYQYSHQAHLNQTRASGEPYISHPIAVAEILAEYQMDADTIIAGFLHDVLEDTEIPYQSLSNRFGERVAMLVQSVTKVGKIGQAYKNEAEIENLRRMLIATAENVQVIIIKLADRLHNMKTLQFLPRHKQRAIAQQTLDIYAPLAHRLGLGRFKWQLEDLCLMFLNPEAYDKIKKRVAQKRAEREQYITQAVKELEEGLLAENIHATVEGRAKHFYSIYMKMLRDNKTFTEIYDLIALRVICGNIGDCYAVLGEVHTMWRQVEGRFKDYISCPKANNYRSIHTTVLGPHGRLIEIQIRTLEMHLIAEQGVAAHWKYKEESQRRQSRGDLKWQELFSQELPDTHDPEDFLRSIRTDLFSDEVYVYTPKGDLFRMPAESTPIDFAYRIHTELGHKCNGAKVNNRLVPLNHSLKTGDVVKIMTSPNNHPSPAWLDIAKTASARNKIRRFLLESRRDELIGIGQANLTRELKKAGFNALEFYHSDKAEEICKSLGMKNNDDLFVNIGFGRISIKQVLARLLQPKTPHPKKTETPKPVPAQNLPRSVVRMGDIDNIMYRLALCCNPLPGDNIMGFVTRGRGVTIHKTACRNITHHIGETHRIIPLFWEGDRKDRLSVSVEIHARDRRNLLGDLSQMISSTNTNILACHSESIGDMAVFTFKVEVLSTSHLNTIMQQLLGIEGVKTVRRLKDENTRPNRKKGPSRSS
ncbi:MAG: RelA/SpoT family protein [bacterium]|nr:RelA/SpoT family protein [bacterium]